MEFATILLHKKDGVASVIFNRMDKLNAANPQMFAELDTALTLIERDEEIRVVVLTGQENSFSAGADVGTLDFSQVVNGFRFMKLVSKAFLHFERLPQPVIAAVNGYAYGFGTEITLAADVVIASDRATFGLKEIGHGVLPAMTILRGREVLGRQNIAYLALTGDTIDAHQAQAMGLVSKVVPHEQLGEEVERIAAKLRDNPPLAMDAIRRVLHCHADEDYNAAIGIMPAIFMTEDLREGRRAFTEKRRPRFQGK